MEEKKKFNRASVTAPRLAARVLARKQKERESFGASRAEIEPADGGRGSDIDRAEQREPREKRRTHGGLCDTKEERGFVPCALSLVARGSWCSQRQTGCLNRLEGSSSQVATDGRIMGGFWREGKPQQQSATELERERAGCSECSNSYSTSKSQLGVGGG